ncbi:MAG: XRE family transcriptional regulator [Rubrivivax sp.]|nr:MAG: XRE family transcriptional regulator [Rubrivivax sp.]
MSEAAGSTSTVVRPRIRAVLAVNLIRLRASKGWSQDALALEAGMHRTFIAHVERQARNVSLESLEKIATALGVQTFELLLTQDSLT